MQKNKSSSADGEEIIFFQPSSNVGCLVFCGFIV